MSGEFATQTPPWPTAIPDGMLSPSAKTVNRVGPAIAVGIFEDLDPVAARPRLAPRVFQALGDPDPPAFVEGHRHRIDDVGLAGDQLDREAGRDRHRLDRLGRPIDGARVRSAQILAVRNV